MPVQSDFELWSAGMELASLASGAGHRAYEFRLFESEYDFFYFDINREVVVAGNRKYFGLNAKGSSENGKENGGEFIKE